MPPAKIFQRDFLYLIVLTWLLPPVIGLGFILFIQVLTPQQMLGILFTPTEPLYIFGWLGFAVWYFPRYIRPVRDWIASPSEASAGRALKSMRLFPLYFWCIFLLYLALAPGSVILSAEYYTDYIAKPIDWFRIQLVALIVSIIVGLPIFFLILDLFGRALGNIRLTRPQVTIKAKIFLVGALVPLLIDTMLVQYYWTRTGFFTFETFLVWLVLELLAIAGSLIFVHSIRQSIEPLHQLIENDTSLNQLNTADLVPCSTDELGVLTNGYRQLLQELENRVEERTADLKASNQELESFSYSVSHDLRAPLRAIDGYSQALLEDCSADLATEGVKYLDRIRHNTQRMAELIDDLLSLSRIGRSNINLQVVDLKALALEIMQELSDREADRNINFEIDIDHEVVADRKLLRIALENLLSNALKYTRNKQAVEITFASRFKDGKAVYSVRDNGAGFDMSYANKLFNAFQRLHRSEEYEGTGIGLATVDRIVRRHGGQVWAESEVGRGATFFFSLPDSPDITTTPDADQKPGGDLPVT